MTCAECVHSRPLTPEERRRFEFVPQGQIVCEIAGYRIDSGTCELAKATPGQGELAL